MRFATFLIGILLVLQPVCLQAAVAVQSASSVDFSQFETFAWKQGTPAPDPETEKLIRESVQKQLLAKGLARVEGKADILVSTHARRSSETREDVDILNRPQPWVDDAERSGVSGEYLRELEVGTLVVDILDGRSGLNIWRAIATRVLTDSSKGAQKRIDKATRRMFESFGTDAD